MKKIKIAFCSLLLFAAVAVSNPVVAQPNDNRMETRDTRDDTEDDDMGKWGLAGLFGLLGLLGLRKNNTHRDVRTTDQRANDTRNK